MNTNDGDKLSSYSACKSHRPWKRSRYISPRRWYAFTRLKCIRVQRHWLPWIPRRSHITCYFVSKSQIQQITEGHKFKISFIYYWLATRSYLVLSSPLTVSISHICPSAFPLELYFVNIHFYFTLLLLINSIRRYFTGHSPFCYQRSSTVPCCWLLETIYTERGRLEISSNSYEGFSVYSTITCMFKWAERIWC